MQKFTSEIKKLGLDLGFNKVGLSPAIQPVKSKKFRKLVKKGIFRNHAMDDNIYGKTNGNPKFFPWGKIGYLCRS